MIDPFELEASYYDRIWGLADRYERGARFLDPILKKRGAHRILDLGCGTGGHCLKLARLGYDMAGLDISRAMLRRATERFSKVDMRAEFVLSDMIEASSSLQSARITSPFDAVICMGYSLAHMLDDKSFGKALDEIRKILKQEGTFIFCVSNAEQLRDDLMKQLRMETIVNEPDLQLALLCHNFRDATNPDVLVWNSLWLINEHGKIDFQVRTHPLRWFRYDDLKTMLEGHGYSVIHTYGDTLGQEVFDENRHDTILMTCQKE